MLDKKNPSTVQAKPGAVAPAKVNEPLAQPPKLPVAPSGNSAPGQPAALDSAARKSAPLFGGHRGAGRKREDGLPAGSPEAQKVDREKDAKRKRDERANKKVASLPPTLPRAAASFESPVAPVPAGESDLRPAVDAAQVASAPVSTLGMFVAWSQKTLERPVKLLVKIIDRVRCSSLMKRVRKLGLTEKQEKEIAGDIAYKQNVVEDFSSALSNCVTIEFNKRRVPGAEHSHWIDVGLTGGELVMIHLNTVDKLEKMVAENAEKKLKAAGGE